MLRQRSTKETRDRCGVGSELIALLVANKKEIYVDVFVPQNSHMPYGHTETNTKLEGVSRIYVF